MRFQNDGYWLEWKPSLLLFSFSFCTVRITVKYAQAYRSVYKPWMRFPFLHGLKFETKWFFYFFVKNFSEENLRGSKTKFWHEMPAPRIHRKAIDTIGTYVWALTGPTLLVSLSDEQYEIMPKLQFKSIDRVFDGHSNCKPESISLRPAARVTVLEGHLLGFRQAAFPFHCSPRSVCPHVQYTIPMVGGMRNWALYLSNREHVPRNSLRSSLEPTTTYDDRIR